MDKKRTPDKIDLELSRTYFASDAEKTKRRSVRIRFLAVTLLVLLVLVSFAIYFFSRNRVTFSININVENRNEKTQSPTQINESKTSGAKKILASSKHDFDIVAKEPDLENSR